MRLVRSIVYCSAFLHQKYGIDSKTCSGDAMVLVGAEKMCSLWKVMMTMKILSDDKFAWLENFSLS